MSDIFNPKISIVIPVYNGANYLAEAIDCALAQTYGNFEVIVVNDGSTDDGATEKIALSYGDKIRYFKKENGGVSSALNYGISVMEGEYFSWLSHDDKYTPDKLLNAVQTLAQLENKEKMLVCSGGNIINERGETVRVFSNVFVSNEVNSSDRMLKISAEGYTLNGCALLIPKTAFLECGMFDESLRYSQDKFMWYKMFLAGYSLVANNEPDVMYRLHTGQTSQTRKDLFVKDSLYVAKYLVPKFLEYDGELLYKYTMSNAKYNLVEVVKLCRDAAKEKNVFSFGQRIRISSALFYGKFRGLLKKIYYKLVLRVKV